MRVSAADRRRGIEGGYPGSGRTRLARIGEPSGVLSVRGKVPFVPKLAELKVGDAAPPLVIENLTRTHFVKYAGASGDFNPMHHDDTIAAQVGNPSVFGHGMLSAGLMARVVKDWFGPEAMRKFNVRFAKQVWPGESLTFTAVVTGVNDDGEEGLVELELSAKNADGEEKLAGTATARVAK